jgi:hypothetical protein
MSIDRQRIAAVQKLEEMGYTFPVGEWVPPANSVRVSGGDTMHNLLVRRADDLANSPEGSIEERELAAISAAIEAFEVSTGRLAARAERSTVVAPSESLSTMQTKAEHRHQQRRARLSNPLQSLAVSDPKLVAHCPE